MDSEELRFEDVLRIWGWIEVKLSNKASAYDALLWCQDHVEQGKWTRIDHGQWISSSVTGSAHRRFAFEREEDATLFALRWAW